ncbi:MFS transporter [Chromobacterium sp. LK1]|uniref:MFS transporter n=1 Tax=Chromobacterium sp. LK1 TaxID=1628193 RepID=UPI000652EBE9|nr:MFS transporter [Chromobacterium sp. LK1]KMN37796.1 MFS transporter [Chromobacterium sp. LK1]
MDAIAPQDTVGSQSGAALYRKIAWRIMPLLMLCYVAAYLDRVNISFAKLQMSRDLAFSDTIFGLGSGIFFLGYFLFEVPSNLALNRIGARVWIARIMITWGLISAAFAWVETPAAFYTLRFLLGAAEAGFYPGIILYLTYWFPSHRRARMVALFMSAIPLSGIFGSPLSGWIMDGMAGIAGWAGWQWMFVLEAVPAVLLGLVVLRCLEDSAERAHWLTKEEKTRLNAELDADNAHKPPRGSARDAFTDRRVWLMCLIYFCFVMGQYGVTFWLPSFIRNTGVASNLAIGLLSAIPFLAAVLAMNLLGRSADARRERRWHLALPALTAAAGFVAVALFPDSTALSLLALCLAAAGVLSCAPLFWSLPTAFLSGGAAAAGIAIINSVGNLAGFASPFLVGTLKDLTGDNAVSLTLLALCLVIGALAVLRIPAALVNR